MANFGDWSNHDNKRYVGKIDRVNVSMTEDYEVEYFIDRYLSTRGFSLSNRNRDLITQALEAFPGEAPYKREELNAYLDGRFKNKHE